MATQPHSWQAIQARIRQNIKDRTWSPGDLIPGEAELAEQFGCARTTVNRALRELAATGVIDRKRKAGTRVAKQETRRVTAEIPVIRAQVEAQKLTYRFALLANKYAVPPVAIRRAMQVEKSTKILHIRSVHFADEQPFIYEDRWVNTDTISEIRNVDLAKTSANEWLVQHIPFTSGEFIVEACLANRSVAKALGVSKSEPVLSSRRSTWLEGQSVTVVQLYYASGYQLRFEI